MSHRLTVTLLATALLAACQSNHTTEQSPETDAATAAADAYVAEEAAAVAHREQATLDRVVVTGARLRSEQAKSAMATGHAYAPASPPPPPAPVMSQEYRIANVAIVPQANPANTERYAERDDNRAGEA